MQMHNAVFYLALTAIMFAGAYALLNPCGDSLAMLKEVCMAVIVGKVALSLPMNGNGNGGPK